LPFLFTASEAIPFSDKDGLHFGAPEPHYFGGVPLIEYIENEERQGAFEQVESAITGYEKAISEKANDVRPPQRSRKAGFRGK